MRRERNCVRGGSVLAAAGVLALAGQASAAFDIGPSYGTVELRWRERSTAGYNGSYVLGPGAVAGVDAFPTPDPTASAVLTQDATVVLVLEARVTAAEGMAGNPLRGLRAAVFDVVTNQTAGGAFARQQVTDGNPSLNPRANAKVNALNLGFDPAALPGHPGGTPRGVVAPFRSLADQSGAGANGPALGLVEGNLNRVRSALVALESAPLDPGNIDATHPGQYDKAGLDAWVPLYVAIYTITDVTTERDIVFTVANPATQVAQGITDYNFRGWRGDSNTMNSGLDFWQLTPGFTSAPTFTVHVVPGPGAAGAFAVFGIAMVRRRRS